MSRARQLEPATVEVREATVQSWPDIAQLFGANGACAGCWCMYWRLERGERFEDVKGTRARRRFRRLLESDRAHGMLAYSGTEPVGWCAFERRIDLPRLDRAPSLAVDDAERVWSLPCFFVKAGWRGRGVAAALLRAAEVALRARGAEIAEGYPTRPPRVGRMAAAWAYTGLPTMFAAAGFEPADRRPRGKQRYRKLLGAPRPARGGSVRSSV